MKTSVNTKYKTLTVDRKKVTNEWGLPYDDDPENGIVIIEDSIADISRWSIHHNLIVKIDGRTYQTTYSVGATEYQDEQPWQDDTTVEFTEVHGVEKTITVWQPVPAA